MHRWFKILIGKCSLVEYIFVFSFYFFFWQNIWSANWNKLRVSCRLFMFFSEKKWKFQRKNPYTPDNSSAHMMMMADDNTTFSALNVPTPCRTCSTAINAIFWSFGVTITKNTKFLLLKWMGSKRKTTEQKNKHENRITVCKHQARCAHSHTTHEKQVFGKEVYRQFFDGNSVIHSSRFFCKVF